MKILDNIRFVLVGTTHPGNIGAAARAMKTMGLSNLHLVEPKIYPSAEATARASGADDVLAKAVVHDSLDAAIAGCQQVYGMSARLRHLPVPVVNPREAVEKIQQASDETNIAIVFGREHSGLSNEELDRCLHLINIPANPVYSSLNLAAAVQVLAYELKMSFDPTIEIGRIGEDREAIDSEDLEHLYNHFEQSLTTIGFLDPEKPRNLIRRLRRLFNRADLDRNELQILHGILRAAETKQQDKGGE
ncbi:MAG: tRNA (cytosine(32)/uridine(32)-2'-O)-methyltransferase TrmJ [Gammaproteobacteria bacterium]|nr:MAG: tRNA (cytosine(32)/uridine(32)-2'-O)-methyltransferase TrmJ [Gammaproteobacteria bacterium]RKZ98263.1 MAG: tRNA (cytosine(32)/uridine(32)-2'-O)-methyltransferase TrmJ [Gammaproteobacteria bacterium]RKZ99316.1 MAG: tRNA (cytosine(32)/uridine(32)-2'-O)-methyltransferase TrmJ [Gammaproteobacteria bacterium]HHA18466.1 RNA methyltransferase [Methylophaga sp.]